MEHSAGDDAIRETFGEVSETGPKPLDPTDILTAFADVTEVAKRLDEPTLSPLFVERIVAEHPSREVVIAALEHPNCPLSAFGVAVRRDEAEIRHWVARHPRTPGQALAYLADNGEPHIRRLMLGNPATPVEVRSTIAVNGDAALRVAAASGPLSSWAVNVLLGDSRPEVRQAVAGRHVVLPTESSRLCEDPSSTVRLGLAESLAQDPYADRRTLERLARDPDREVREVAARALEALR